MYYFDKNYVTERVSYRKKLLWIGCWGISIFLRGFIQFRTAFRTGAQQRPTAALKHAARAMEMASATLSVHKHQRARMPDGRRTQEDQSSWAGECRPSCRAAASWWLHLQLRPAPPLPPVNGGSTPCSTSATRRQTPATCALTAGCCWPTCSAFSRPSPLRKDLLPEAHLPVQRRPGQCRLPR